MHFSLFSFLLPMLSPLSHEETRWCSSLSPRNRRRWGGSYSGWPAGAAAPPCRNPIFFFVLFFDLSSPTLFFFYLKSKVFKTNTVSSLDLKKGKENFVPLLPSGSVWFACLDRLIIVENLLWFLMMVLWDSFLFCVTIRVMCPFASCALIFLPLVWCCRTVVTYRWLRFCCDCFMRSRFSDEFLAADFVFFWFCAAMLLCSFCRFCFFFPVPQDCVWVLVFIVTALDVRVCWGM